MTGQTLTSDEQWDRIDAGIEAALAKRPAIERHQLCDLHVLQMQAFHARRQGKDALQWKLTWGGK